MNSCIFNTSVSGSPSTAMVDFTPSGSQVEIRIIKNDSSDTKDFYILSYQFEHQSHYTAYALNDGFSSWGNWTTTGSLSASQVNNQMYVSGNDQGDYVYTTVSVNSGTTYTLTADIDCGSASNISVEVWESGNPIATYTASCPSCTANLSFTASSGSIEIRIVRNDPSGFVDFTVDNVQLDYTAYNTVVDIDEDYSAGAGSWSLNMPVYQVWNLPSRMKITGSSQGDYIHQNVSVIPGKVYNLQMDVDCGIASSVSVSVFQNSSQLAANSINRPAGSANLNFTPTSNVIDIRIIRTDPNGISEDIYVDNVSLVYYDSVYTRYNCRFEEKIEGESSGMHTMEKKKTVI